MNIFSTSNIIIPNQELKARYDSYGEEIALKPLSIFGILTRKTASWQGEFWLDQLLNTWRKIRTMPSGISTTTSRPSSQPSQKQPTFCGWISGKQKLEHFLMQDVELWFNQGLPSVRKATGLRT